ncbi:MULTISPECIES: EamA family transporter [unclassified Methylophaga]|jgi:drug/metabolite transporter (DMT)-like permease|uniref:EamA family transporter n=1 Tax=unclassified Methylophaga TaxID=2629249 RepID=UPI000C992DED|nr:MULTISPECIES: EamA family transporter [unclassified Methylophaga]MAK66486.1 multidrug transporter [Methylophaga sp.]MAY17179.1 multidrug transporter [Methylophaga sp.]MBN46027.1 multidrug transporter [Methylophaga sp.]|tara:strand:- start:18793 stop:19665 length:873 start_codon:yes stop_codon:yes gene_type:complete
MELLIVLGRVFSSAAANVFQKQFTHKGLHSLFIVMLSYVVLASISLPLLILVEHNAIEDGFWLNILLAALLDMAGTLFLVLSLSKTDLSVFGPLNAYKVVFSMILALIFLDEVPNLQGFTGVIIILLGSFLLFPPVASTSSNRLWHLFRQRGVQYRFLSILLFSIGTLPLKNAVLSGGALATTLYWCLFGLPLSVGLYYRFGGKRWQKDWQTANQHRHHFLWLGSFIFLMQYTTMLVFSQLLVAYSLALFQLSMVLQVFLGYRIFHEKHILRRLSACGVMIAGCLLVLTT